MKKLLLSLFALLLSLTLPRGAHAAGAQIKLDVAQCTYHAAGALPYILAGASRQTLFLASERPECQARLDRLTSLEASGLKPISIGSLPSSRLDEGQGQGIELSSIPATLPTGELTFTLKANGEPIGTVTLLVLEGISAGDSPKVDVKYDLLDIKDVPQGFAARANDGIAVVTPKGADAEDRILNTVSIPIKPPLLSPSSWDDIQRIKDGKRCSDDKCPVLGDRSTKWIWQIRPTKGAPLLKACDGKPSSSPCILPDGPGTIAFSMKEESSSSIEAALELVEIVQGTIDTPNKGPKEQWYRERSLFETTVRLAASARLESVPLPIRDRLYVDCRGANSNVTNSEMRAIYDDDVVNGTCALVLLPVSVGTPGPSRKTSLYRVKESKLDKAELVECERESSDSCSKKAKEEAWQTSIDRWVTLHDSKQQARRLNRFYGSQRLIVVVKRDGKEIAIKRWIINPSQLTWLELPHGTDTERGSLYSVEVRVAARPTADVVYATAKDDNGKSDDSDIPQTDLRFSAQLRSRGPFGIKAAWFTDGSFLGFRVYATIPVQLVGFRFPAATNELRASSDPLIVQYMTPRTGLLGVVEPWSYDTGQNPWPLNPAIAGGLLAFDLAKPRINVSTLLGIQFQAPLLKPDTSQLSSTIALGMFWEHSVEEKENRFLVTFGANVLSLFAGK